MSELARQVVDGDRRALARAITLAESTRGDHRAEAEALLAEVLPPQDQSEQRPVALRIAALAREITRRG